MSIPARDCLAWSIDCLHYENPRTRYDAIVPTYPHTSHLHPTYIILTYLHTLYLHPTFIVLTYLASSYLHPTYIPTSFLHLSYIVLTYIHTSYLPTYIVLTYIVSTCSMIVYFPIQFFYISFNFSLKYFWSISFCKFWQFFCFGVPLFFTKITFFTKMTFFADDRPTWPDGELKTWECLSESVQFNVYCYHHHHPLSAAIVTLFDQIRRFFWLWHTALCKFKLCSDGLHNTQ